jgi:hypothetical protein
VSAFFSIIDLRRVKTKNEGCSSEKSRISRKEIFSIRSFKRGEEILEIDDSHVVAGIK